MKVFGFAGYSGSGKTTLLERLVPLLRRAGLRVSLIKHAHHAFDIDQPGKDSYRLRAAGCHEVMIASSQRWALMHELRGESEPDLDQLLARLGPCDLVLVEGYKSASIPKIEVYRAGSDAPPLFPGDPNIVALATERRLVTTLPQFHLDEVAAIADFMLRHLHLASPRVMPTESELA